MDILSRLHNTLESPLGMGSGIVAASLIIVGAALNLVSQLPDGPVGANIFADMEVDMPAGSDVAILTDQG